MKKALAMILALGISLPAIVRADDDDKRQVWALLPARLATLPPPESFTPR